MNTEQIKKILKKIKNVKIAVYGDFCLDAYWVLDPTGGEMSVETGLHAEAVLRHYYTLGGASNVVANLAALKPAAIQAIGVVGPDIFGKELLNQLDAIGADTGAMVIQQDNYNTVTFAKRYLGDVEKPRIDFGFFNKRTNETDDILITNLRNAFETCDAVIFNQQVPDSINNSEFIEKANRLFEEYTDKIVLFDSRHYGDKFKGVYRKTNDIEAARLNGVDAAPSDIITLNHAKTYIYKLYKKDNKPVFLTRGSRGILVADESGIDEIPGIQILKKIDTVGAGDTTISALCLCLAADIKPVEAAVFANYAAAVTVQKLFQTGTANAEEILSEAQKADYIYQPELAEDIRQATYFDPADIEISYPVEKLTLGHIKHAIFDHDGTISTLREGWEHIMEPVMIKAIMGSHYETAEETLYHKVLIRVRDYIDKSTGIQTILQMEGLVEMVREFGLVSEHEILDKNGYKEVYNDALMGMVNNRTEKFHNGQLDISDYTIKGALELLKALKVEKVKLYLASGTDYQDVVNEATVLGYADLFDGGIYGAVGDIDKYSKKMVIEKIINDNNLNGHELVVFGDGPVEIRECRKKEGIAVGVASDEVRRHGLMKDKRSRLIKAGAHIIVPDFAQYRSLLGLLFLRP